MKNISNNKQDFTIGGMYGSSGAYIVEDLSKSFDNLVIILDNNNQAISLNDNVKIDFPGGLLSSSNALIGASKELIEFNNRREGPILEGDQKFFFKLVLFLLFKKFTLSFMYKSVQCFISKIVFCFFNSL